MANIIQLYPYPALVLIHELDSQDGTPAPTIDDLEPLTALWTNTAWKRHAGTRSLAETLSAEDLMRLDRWLSRRQPSEPEEPPTPSKTVRTAGTLNGNPHGVVNGYLDKHLDMLSHERGTDAPGLCRSPEPVPDPPPDDTPLIVQCSLGLPMALAKTMFPVTVCPPHQLRRPVPQYALFIVTSMPHQPSYTVPCEFSEGPWPRLPPAFRSEDDRAETDTAVAPVPTSVQLTEPRRTSSVTSSADGHCSASTPATSVFSRDDNDVRHLLETYDWSSTGLGPKKDWPWVLNLLTSFAMCSPLSISMWWGNKDMTLIYNKPYSEVSMRALQRLTSRN